MANPLTGSGISFTGAALCPAPAFEGRFRYLRAYVAAAGCTRMDIEVTKTRVARKHAVTGVHKRRASR